MRRQQYSVYLARDFCRGTHAKAVMSQELRSIDSAMLQGQESGVAIMVASTTMAISR